MNEDAFTLEESILGVSQVPGLLKHPRLSWGMMDAGNLYSSGGQLNYKENKESCQAGSRPGFHRKEIAGPDTFPV